jgi:hypothetical protein
VADTARLCSARPTTRTFLVSPRLAVPLPGAGIDFAAGSVIMRNMTFFQSSPRRLGDMRVILFAGTAVWVSGGCSSSDNGPCPAGQVLRYEAPGCGAEAQPVCGPAMQDACFRPVCSCNGETISRCDFASEPFASFGYCSVSDGGSPDTAEVRVDGGPCPAGQVLRYEAPGCGAEAKPVCGSPVQDACFRPVCSCNGATISRCDFASEPFASFGSCDGGVPERPEVRVDGGPCPAGQVLRYEAPGCGVEAKPVCGSPVQDACFRPVCSCSGATISRCDFASEPFASFGSCDGGGHG